MDKQHDISTKRKRKEKERKKTIKLRVRSTFTAYNYVFTYFKNDNTIFFFCCSFCLSSGLVE